VTMAAGWCGGRGPSLPDPGRATWRYALTTGESQPGRTSGKRSKRGVGAWVGGVPRPPPLRPRRPPRPHPRSARGEELQGERLAARRRTVVGQ
jgi:hypothetical protein